MDCEKLSHVIAVRRDPDGTETPFRWCRHFGKVTVETEQVRRALGLDQAVTCEGCPFVAIDRGDYLTCRHRGAATGETINCRCGNDRNIYSCAVHGRCLKRLPVGEPRHKFPEVVGAVVCREECMEWRS